jgi:hypothetical protein
MLLALARIFYLLEGHELELIDFLQLSALVVGFAMLGCITIAVLRAKVVGDGRLTSQPSESRSGSDPALHLPPRDSRC